MSGRGRAALLAALSSLALGAGCTLAPATAGGAPSTSNDVLPPPGYGTLRQEEVSMELTSGNLVLMVTPLHPSVTRVTAPDTERRLASLAAANPPVSFDPRGLFLVSFYSDEPDTRFVPEEVQLVSQGLRIRPASISPITPNWGQHRVPQRGTEMAVYTFAGSVDLESDLVLVYGLEQSRSWSITLPRIQAERARARARAGIGTPRAGASRSTARAAVQRGVPAQPSSSYFAILR